MTEVKTGGTTTANKATRAGGPKVGITGDPDRIREVVHQGETAQGVVFVADDYGHGYLESPRPLYDDHGREVGTSPGVFVDFQGVGRTKTYDPRLADDAHQIDALRRIIEQRPLHRDVAAFNIRELAADEPAPPLEKWNTLKAALIAAWIEPQLGSNHDDNVRLVQECAKYEIANANRDDVLQALDLLLVQEASKSDGFSATVKLA